MALPIDPPPDPKTDPVPIFVVPTNGVKFVEFDKSGLVETCTWTPVMCPQHDPAQNDLGITPDLRIGYQPDCEGCKITYAQTLEYYNRVKGNT